MRCSDLNVRDKTALEHEIELKAVVNLRVRYVVANAIYLFDKLVNKLFLATKLVMCGDDAVINTQNRLDIKK